MDSTFVALEEATPTATTRATRAPATAPSPSLLLENPAAAYHQQRQRQQLRHRFAHRKAQCLGKMDKSSAGRIDPKAVEICHLLNSSSNYFTTSSCAGRCFLYQGVGNKANDSQFRRFRVNHNLIADPIRYFNLETLQTDPTGGGDPLRSNTNTTTTSASVSASSTSASSASASASSPRTPTEEQNNDPTTTNEVSPEQQQQQESTTMESTTTTTTTTSAPPTPTCASSFPPFDKLLWLRYEPFILHVACCSLPAAHALLQAARAAGFKNVGLTTWSPQAPFYMVALWGDEGLDMPLVDNNNNHQDDNNNNNNQQQTSGVRHWWAHLVHQRQYRNWDKIQRLVHAVQTMLRADNGQQQQQEADDSNAAVVGDAHDDNYTIDKDDSFAPDDDCTVDYDGIAGHAPQLLSSSSSSKRTSSTTSSTGFVLPKSFDIVGDVAIVHSLPPTVTTEDQQRTIGQAILQRHKNLHIVVWRQSQLQGDERAVGSAGLVPLAWRASPRRKQQSPQKKQSNQKNEKNETNTKDNPDQTDSSTEIVPALRHPLITTHTEFGVRCVVDLHHTFFSPRMAGERRRLCHQVGRGEFVLVLFAGVALEALQIAARTEAASVVVVESNPHAIQCAQRSIRMLQRNKSVVQPQIAADRIQLIQADVYQVLTPPPPQQQQQPIDDTNENLDSTTTASTTLDPEKKSETTNNSATDATAEENGDATAEPNDNTDAVVPLPRLPRTVFDRILAPRPKVAGPVDGDLGDGSASRDFLRLLLPYLNPERGECHWYDFVADWEFPACTRTRQLLQEVVDQHDFGHYSVNGGVAVEVLHVAKVGSIAQRQWRVCIDFTLRPKEKTTVATAVVVE